MKQPLNTIKNRAIIGLTCSYIPEEILVAAGFNPFRIYGDIKPPELAASFLPASFCPYVLSCLDCGLQGSYDFLDGIIIASSCNAMRRLYDAWRYSLKTPFVYMLDVPKSKDLAAENYFEQVLGKMIESIEKYFKVKITDEALMNAISICNETRELISQLYESKNREELGIADKEIRKLIQESRLLPKEELNKKLKSILSTKGDKEIGSIKTESPVRLLITGSYHQPSDLIDYIESIGATVVYEDICVNGRYLQKKIELTNWPLRTIAHSYIHKPPCARMLDNEARISYVLQLAKQYKANGVIYYALKFCDTHLLDYPLMRKGLNKAGLPVLFLEGDSLMPSSGQIKTRIKAFLEVFNCSQAG